MGRVMDLKKLPPSILLALGLACGDDDKSSETVGPCLDVDPTASSATDSATSTSGTDTGTPTVGPCLDVDPSTTDDTGPVTTGPCLEPPLETTGGDTDTDGTGGSTGSETTGGALSDAPDRQRSLERFADALPEDVLSRLRKPGKGTRK